MQTITIICLLFIAAKIIMKLVFWLMIKQRSFKMFVGSFFRRYSVYDMHDAPNPATLTFWKVSNFCNVILWLAVVVLVMNYYVNLTSVGD